ncbi:MAG: CAP domain-containing protein [Saccharopolyspora sp.]|uniref:CAP domain-containing protein n=2 Tax=Pseudonocardiaceae TaxID=2070 RepID=UPI00190BA99F|nr:CAP domain-containing protein [Saccharopolyspora sp. HNM0986]MBK0865284.1 CAP domain-containing protein [Saccharopolyspora sp. HNM0986]MBQ6640343.1 CAP domain-containing protein [Saccharopolyspora sp.]
MARTNFKRTVIASGLVAAALGAGAAMPAQALAADAGQQNRVVELVNQQRAGAGCGPVKVDKRLTQAANGHSSDMANRNYFSHDTPEGVSFDKRIKNAGYPSPGAENIAAGQSSPEQVMNAWMKSPGHKKNILNCKLNKIGVGVETSGWNWTQDFGY